MHCLTNAMLDRHISKPVSLSRNGRLRVWPNTFGRCIAGCNSEMDSVHAFAQYCKAHQIPFFSFPKISCNFPQLLPGVCVGVVCRPRFRLRLRFFVFAIAALGFQEHRLQHLSTGELFVLKVLF